MSGKAASEGLGLRLDLGANDPPLMIVVGSGGVGKTTLAAAMGLASADAGLDTLVMTFDPSLRLKDALGVGDATDDEEIEVFEKFFGNHSYKEDLDLEKLAADLDDRIKTVKEQASVPQAMQVVRDLCLVARAEGHIEAAEEAVLDRIADGLDVPREFVCQTMESELDPD